MGPTPLSMLVCGGKGDFYRTCIVELLDDEALVDSNTWACLWDYIPEHLESRAVALVATLGLSVACSYEFRMVQYFSSLHVQVLYFVEKPKL